MINYCLIFHSRKIIFWVIIDRSALEIPSCKIAHRTGIKNGLHRKIAVDCRKQGKNRLLSGTGGKQGKTKKGSRF